VTTLLAIAKEEAACRAAPWDGATWAWHLHHDQLCEPIREPIANRIDYILTTKPEAEWALRLRLLRPIRSEIPAAVDKARAAYDKAWAAYDKALAARDTAWAAYDTAWAASDKALAAYATAWAAYDKAQAAPAVLALHAIECPDCPWDGQTISG